MPQDLPPFPCCRPCWAPAPANILENTLSIIPGWKKTGMAFYGMGEARKALAAAGFCLSAEFKSGILPWAASLCATGGCIAFNWCYWGGKAPSCGLGVTLDLWSRGWDDDQWHLLTWARGCLSHVVCSGQGKAHPGAKPALPTDVKPQKNPFSSLLRLCSLEFVNPLLPRADPAPAGRKAGIRFLLAEAAPSHIPPIPLPPIPALPAELCSCTMVGGEMIRRWISLERKQLSSSLSRCQGFIPDCNPASGADSAIYVRK